VKVHEIYSEEEPRDEENIKLIFEEHIARVGTWPPAWSDIEDLVREAYWKGVQSGSIGDDYESR